MVKFFLLISVLFAAQASLAETETESGMILSCFSYGGSLDVYGNMTTGRASSARLLMPGFSVSATALGNVDLTGANNQSLHIEGAGYAPVAYELKAHDTELGSKFISALLVTENSRNGEMEKIETKVTCYIP